MSATIIQLQVVSTVVALYNNIMALRRIPPKVSPSLCYLGKNIQIARENHGLSRKDLAARVGVSVKTIEHLEAGDPEISIGVLAMSFSALDHIERFRKILRVSSDQIDFAHE